MPASVYIIIIIIIITRGTPFSGLAGFFYFRVSTL